MVVELDGHAYQATVASDLDRDGLYLEVQDSAGQMLAVIFYSDVEHTLKFTAHRPDLPIALVEWMVAYSRERLVPSEKSG